MKPTIIINEQHSLLNSQVELLLSRFGVDGWNTLCVPASGWTKDEMDAVMVSADLETRVVVFVSPIPYMIKTLAADAATHDGRNDDHGGLLPSQINSSIEECLVMANDHRVKKELPNGKIISVTAQEGWYLA